MGKVILGAMLAVALASPVAAAEGVPVKRIGDPQALINDAIWAGDTLYLSGFLSDPDVAADKAAGKPPAWTSDTKTQAIGAIQKIEKILKAQGLGLGDIVQMQVFLAGDPGKDDKMDFAGWNAAYQQYFGTAEQPNKPVRATVQVARLAAPGALIEIMVTAVKARKK